MRSPHLSLLLLALSCAGGCAPTDDPSIPGARDAGSFFERDADNPRAIVFVHGVLGDARATWTHPQSGAFFPQLLTEDPTFDEADVFVYDFPSEALTRTYSLDQLTEHLWRTLEDRGVLAQYEEIVFVAHSMGGIVSRAFLLKYGDQIDVDVPMIYFFSTPTAGSSLSRYGAVLGDNIQFDGMTELDDNTYLQQQQSTWLAQGWPSRVRTFCAYETRETHGALVVDQASATTLCNERLDPIAADHIAIVKPRDAADEPMVALRIAYRATFETPDEVVELTADTLPSFLSALRSQARRGSYVVREAIDLSQLVRDREEWWVNDLTFEGDGKLYVGAIDLTLDVRRGLSVEREGMQILASFAPDQAAASPGQNGSHGPNGPGKEGDGANGGHGESGQPGEPGVDGQDSGDVELRLRRLPTNRFTVALPGQSGGPGGNGGKGGAGGNGTRGRAGKSGPFGCERGGGDGGDGGNGGRGGDAGPGGACGAGGQLTVQAPESLRAQILERIDLDPTAASAGSPGNPGQGGAAGRSGQGGNGSGFCRGGRRGSNGQAGGDGSTPPASGARCSSPRVIAQ